MTLVLLMLLADTDAAKAKAVVEPYKKALKEALVEGLKRSPEEAVEICATQAPTLAKQFSVNGVQLGRAAVKVRNPNNRPPQWLVAPMAALAKEKPGTNASRLVRLPGGRFGYAEAIWTQPLCLTCHGASLAPNVSAAIAKRYPLDEATGFAVDDFRGVFWAELPAAPPGQGTP
jgi:hypothetical protein